MASAVLLGRFGEASGFEHELAVFRGGGRRGFGFAVHGLGDGGGAADFVEEEDFDLEDAGFVGDAELVAEVDFASRVWRGGC